MATPEEITQTLTEAAQAIHTAVPGAMNAQMADAFEKVGLAFDALVEERQQAMAQTVALADVEESGGEADHPAEGE
jgi:hypothetical protein